MTELRVFDFTPFDPLKFLPATGPSARTVAVEFAVTSGSWWLKEFRLFRSSWELVGPLEFRLYTVVSASVGTAVAGTDVTLPRVRDVNWQAATLPVPVKLTTGQTYRAACFNPAGFNYETNGWATGVTNGALTAPSRAASVGTSQGAYAIGTSLTYPTLDGGATNWWVDVTLTDVDPATAATAPLASAVEDVERRPIVGLNIDWDRDGYQNPLSDLERAVSELTLERAATADLPLEVGLIEGYAAAELTATLEGELSDGITAFTALAPYRADAALVGKAVAGAPLSCSLGFRTPTGEASAVQFIGATRSLRVDSAERSVSLTALDPADRLRATISLPACAMSQYSVRGLGHKFYIKPQAVIDYVLRRNGIFASPPPHPDAQISCTGHGWLAAEIGTTFVPDGVPSAISADTWWVPGPFDMLAVRGDWTGSAVQRFFSSDPYTPAPGSGLGISAWIRAGSDMGLPAAEERYLFLARPLANIFDFSLDLQLRIKGDGTLGAYLGSNGLTQLLNEPTRWQYVAAHFEHRSNGQTRISLRAGGATTTADVPTPALPGAISPALWAAAYLNAVGWSNLQIWYAPTPPGGAWPGEYHTSQASLDPGLNVLTHLPEVRNGDSWDLIKAVTAAELGTAGFSETGQFTFRQRATLSDSPVSRTLTAERSLTGLATALSIDSVRNVVTTEVTPAYVGLVNVDTLRGPSVLFQADAVDQFDTGPGVTTYVIPLAAAVMPLENPKVLQVTTANWTDPLYRNAQMCVAVQADSPDTEIAIGSGLQIYFRLRDPRTGVLTIHNYTGYQIRLATTDGTPALILRGYQPQPQPTQTDQARAEGSISYYGERTLALEPSPWRQLPAPMLELATELAAILANPLPVIDQVETTGDPQRRLGDTVRILDPAGLGTILATTVQIRHRVSRSNGYRTELAVRPISSPGLGIYDSAELGLWDSTLVWGP